MTTDATDGGGGATVSTDLGGAPPSKPPDREERWDPSRERPEDRPKARSLWPLRALWPLLRPYRGLMLAALAALLAAAGLSLAIPFGLRNVVDGFAADPTGDVAARVAEIDAAFVVVFALAALLALSTALRFYLVTRLGERVVADLRIAVYDRLVGMSPAYFERLRTGEALSRLTTDTTVIQTVVGSSVSVALRNILILIGGAAMLFLTSPRLTLVALIAAPLVVMPVVLLGRRVRRLSRESQDRVADASAFAGETLQAAQTIQAFTYENVARSRFSGAVAAAYDAALRRTWIRAMMTAVVIVIGFSAVVGALWLGARDVIEGRLSGGELAQFVLLALFVAGATAALSEVWGELQRAAGAAERLLEMLTATNPVAPPIDPAAPALGVVRGELTFDGVSFSYPSRPTQSALDGVSFSIEPGETAALVGPSGAGKSTVFQLLLRFFDPQSGRVMLDGVDVRALDPAELRRAFAVVQQDPAIFGASAAENIRIGRPDATDVDVVAAARAAAAHDFLAALPDGYDTQVGERGVTLSGGQRQRLAIARAILRDAPVLLFDEATSALDAESERAIQTSLERLSETRTTLVIAHRLATVRRADKIFVFDGGRIAAVGTHDALAAEGGLYARLARLQFA